MSTGTMTFAGRLLQQIRSDPQAATRVVNSGLRLTGLASRFALMAFLARFLDVATLGQFGLIYAIATMAPAILGFGLHYRLNREIIGRPLDEAGHRIRDRLTLHLIVISAVFFVGFSITFSGLMAKTSLSFVVSLILLLETLSTDIFLSLLSLRKATLANVIVFVKSSAWIPPYISLAYFYPAMRNLDTLMYFWLSALVLTFFVISRQLRGWPWPAIFARKLDFKWLFRDFHKALLIYCGDLGIIGSQYADRFVVNAFLGLSETGVFVFYWNLANGVQQLVTTSIIQLALPKLVDAAAIPEATRFRAAILHEARSVLIAATSFSSLVFMATFVAVPLLGRDVLVENRWILPALLLGAGIKLISDVMNYGMYAKKLDVQLAMINLTSAPMSTIFTFLSLQCFGLSGIGIASIGTASYTLCLRLYTLRHVFLELQQS